MVFSQTTFFGSTLRVVTEGLELAPVSFVFRQESEPCDGFEMPDLAVEVVSPNDTHTEVTEKALAWLEAGSHMVVVVDPSQRTATVYRSLEDIRILTEGDAIEGVDVVPGWKLPIVELFA
jgi:Uma2 family endonuclease